MRTDPQVNVRMDAEILETLKVLAKANGRSMTAELNHWLGKALPTVKPEVQVKVRMPGELHNFLQEQAVVNNRSVTAEVVSRLYQQMPITQRDTPRRGR